MNKISSVIFLLLITVCLGMPQQYDDEYEDYESAGETATYDDEEANADVATVQTVFKHKSQTLTVTEGDNVDLSCETQTPNNDVIIFKKLNGTGSTKDQILYVGEMKVERRTRFKNAQNVFKLQNVKRNDGGTYICYYQANSDTELRYKLDVQYPSTVKAKTPLKQRVEKGSSVTVECEANGNPKPTIKWSKESGRLPSGAEEEMGYSMTLENVDRHVEGTYICTADNGVGDPVSTSMKLTVEYPPEITTEKAIVRTGEGDKVELVCIVHARPLADVSWSKNGAPLTPDDKITETDGGHRHAITISQVTNQHFGAYQCDAQNEKGRSSAIINLTDLPREPHFTSLNTSADDTSYTLAWETESYYPITEYTVKYRLAKLNESTNLPGEWTIVNVTIPEDDETISEDDVSSSGLVHKMKHTIDDLIPATDYVAVVSVKNKYKWGDEGTFHFSTRKASPTTTTTIATSTTYPPFAEEKVQYPHEETMSLHKTTGGADFSSLNMVLLTLSLFVLSLHS